MQPIIYDKVELSKKFHAFMCKNENLYPAYTREIIISRFKEFLSTGIIPEDSTMNQILTKIGTFPVGQDPYIKFVDRVAEKHDIYVNALNIGGGQYPVEGIYMYEKQRLRLEGKYGNVTVYDSNLILHKYGDMILRREIFDDYTDISKYKLIYSRRIKEPAEIAIIRANSACIPYYFDVSNELPFGYVEDTDSDMTLEKWHELLIEQAQTTKQPGCEISIEYIDSHLQISATYPGMCKKLN